MSKLQTKEHWCGPTAIQNAFRRYGIKHSQAKIAEAAGTTEEGSDQFDIMRGIRALGAYYSEFESDCPNAARRWLHLAYTVPLILCVDRWRHWVTVAAHCVDRVLVLDPDTEGRNVAENGCHFMRDRDLLRKWRATRAQRKDGRLYYGIAFLR